MKKDINAPEIAYWLNKPLGNYIIKSYITSGGFGDVFKAVHKNFSNSIAIKISHAFPQDYYEMLLRMMQASIKKIDIEGIINPIDFGTVDYNDEKRFYVITDFIDGAKTLKPVEAVKSKAEFNSRLNNFNKVLLIVSRLHSYGYYDEFGRKVKGIMHGDLKPSNILVDTKGNIKIIDVLTNLEQVKDEFKTSEDKVDVKLNTSRFGTQGFMSPEQKQKGLLNEQSDIFSLGITLFIYLFCETLDDKSLAFSEGEFVNYYRKINKYVSEKVLKAIWRATRPAEKDRFVSVDEFRESISLNTSLRSKAMIYIPAAILLVIIAFFSVKMLTKPKETNIPITVSDTTSITLSNALEIAKIDASCNNSRGIVKLNYKDDTILDAGRFFAVIIAVNNYKNSGFSPLYQPINNGRELYDVLTNDYTFEKENTFLMEDATRGDIMNKLDSLKNVLNENDNLLIFYAGHGFYNTEKDRGYIIPFGARKSVISGWLAYDEMINEFFDVIKARHILFISDACQAGSVFRGEDTLMLKGIDRMTLNQFRLKSRRAFTSSNLGNVYDKGFFFREMLTALKSNNNTVMLGIDLFIQTYLKVRSKNLKPDGETYYGPELPRYEELRNSHVSEGGQFMFVRRK